MENHFDADVAATYDEDEAEMFSPEVLAPTIRCLAALADGGRALEFAIGTGRVALPLAAAGVEVHGIEFSPAMAAELRAKPGGEHLPVHLGDMANTCVDGDFALVYLVFNTIMNLTTQDAQVACFANAAAHLRPGGRFVVEVMVPQVQRLAAGERFVPFSVTDDHIGLDEYDVVTQALVSHHVRTSAAGVTREPMPFRYVWPAELDLMARLAGLEFEHRWADWSGAPFTATSPSHISVWRRPTT